MTFAWTIDEDSTMNTVLHRTEEPQRWGGHLEVRVIHGQTIKPSAALIPLGVLVLLSSMANRGDCSC